METNQFSGDLWNLLSNSCLQRRERERDYPRHLTERESTYMVISFWWLLLLLSLLIDQVDSSASKFDWVEREKRFIIRSLNQFFRRVTSDRSHEYAHVSSVCVCVWTVIYVFVSFHLLSLIIQEGEARNGYLLVPSSRQHWLESDVYGYSQVTRLQRQEMKKVRD